MKLTPMEAVLCLLVICGLVSFVLVMVEDNATEILRWGFAGLWAIGLARFLQEEV